MTIEEKLEKETGGSIHLYKEGIFWIAYEKSAYALVQHKQLKVSKKYIKKIQQEIVRVGFPSSTLSYLYSQIGNPSKEEDFYIEIKLNDFLSDECFEQWKENQCLYTENLVSQSKEKEKMKSKNEIIEMIATYPLADKTPMETMMFVQGLKSLVVL